MNRSKIVQGLFAAILVVAGCADKVSTKGRPCPCVAGNVCCANDTCAKDQAACNAAIIQSRLDEARGEWTGYIENFRRPDILGQPLSDKIRLSFEVGVDGTLGGRVIFGQAEAPPPPTDPDTAWPDSSLFSDGNILNRGWPETLIEGTVYPAQGISWDELRLRFSVPLWFPWQPWCGLQASYPISNGGFNCLPGNTSSGMGGSRQCLFHGPPEVTAPCAKTFLCSPGSVCACTSTGCTANLSKALAVDIALRDGIGDGSLAIDGQLYNLRVTRVTSP